MLFLVGGIYQHQWQGVSESQSIAVCGVKQVPLLANFIGSWYGLQRSLIRWWKRVFLSFFTPQFEPQPHITNIFSSRTFIFS